MSTIPANGSSEPDQTTAPSWKGARRCVCVFPTSPRTTQMEAARSCVVRASSADGISSQKNTNQLHSWHGAGDERPGAYNASSVVFTHIWQTSAIAARLNHMYVISLMPIITIIIKSTALLSGLRAGEEHTGCDRH